MLLTDFEKNTRTLTTWFKRRLNDEQLDVMYQKLKYIPAPAYKDIVESLVEDSKFFPTIIEIKNRYQGWRFQHPEQVRDYEQTYCPDCHSKGFIWVKALDIRVGRRYEFVYLCGACQNWKAHAHGKAIPMKHRASLERDGFEIIHPKHRAKCEDDLRPMKTNKKREVNEQARRGFHKHPEHEREARR